MFTSEAIALNFKATVWHCYKTLL